MTEFVIPEIGKVYKKYDNSEKGCHLERRLVLDASDAYVLYEILVPPVDGTCVEHNPERKQVGIKKWRSWAKNASISDSGSLTSE